MRPQDARRSRPVDALRRLENGEDLLGGRVVAELRAEARPTRVALLRFVNEVVSSSVSGAERIVPSVASANSGCYGRSCSNTARVPLGSTAGSPCARPSW